jgi:serine-type D-Ala-D-Ala carboxypeptidase (penicillin-binding protein 5/6)
VPARTPAQRLLGYGFNFFETKRVYAAGDALTTARVWKGKQDEVGLTVGRDLYVTSQRGHVSNGQGGLRTARYLVAPLSKNTAIGKANVVVDGQTVATYELYPAADVPEPASSDARGTPAVAVPLTAQRWPTRIPPAG